MSKAQRLNKLVYRLLDENKFEEAVSTIDKEYNAYFESASNDYLLLGAISGSYISAGSEFMNRTIVEKGLQIIDENLDKLLTVSTEPSLHYNRANALSALNRIDQESSTYVIPRLEDAQRHFTAKSEYLKAFKGIELSDLDTLECSILTNLANELRSVGRYVEALQYTDTVLKEQPEFFKACFSKAETLKELVYRNNFPKTPSTFAVMNFLYKAVQKVRTDEYINQAVDGTAQTLIKLGYDINSFKNEELTNKVEFNQHPNYIKFFLTHFMSLSEHGLYCTCYGANTETLNIGTPGMTTQDKKLMRLEHLFNRIKSEFSLSRRLFYEHTNSDTEDNMYYVPLADGIANDIEVERLRTSFRLCFGILDKIAEGIVYLYDLEVAEKGDYIYFHTFWNSTKVRTRWSELNAKQNIHLTALYSIATDLVEKTGEFGFYKTWRNDLEHGILSIQVKEEDKYKILNGEYGTVVKYQDFRNKTEHLIQLTRAAIFSFAFCVRQELIKKEE